MKQYQRHCRVCDKVYIMEGRNLGSICPTCKEKYNSWKGKMWLTSYDRCHFKIDPDYPEIKPKEHNITLDDIIIPERCPVYDTLLYEIVPPELQSVKQFHMASLDRIDNAKGYIKGNVAVISLRANLMKGKILLSDIDKISSYMKRYSTPNDNVTPRDNTL